MVRLRVDRNLYNKLDKLTNVKFKGSYANLLPVELLDGLQNHSAMTSQWIDHGLLVAVAKWNKSRAGRVLL